MHQPGKSNQVADALSQKNVEWLTALIEVETELLESARELAKIDFEYKKLMD